MNRPKSRGENIVVQELAGEILIYDLKNNKAYHLNEPSTLVWNLCDGKRAVTEISQILSRQLKQTVTEDLVWLALDQFKLDNLLESNSLRIEFGGLSRRKMIHKVGLATMAVLPLVIGVTAPKAAMAASGGSIGLFGACPSGTGCGAGLNCHSCFGCTPGVNVLSCCSNPNGARGPGLDPSTNCTLNAADCSDTASQQCCSGTATFTQTGCGNAPTTGTCICN